MKTENLYHYVNASAILKELNEKYPEGFRPSAYRNLEKLWRSQNQRPVTFQSLIEAGIVYRSHIKDEIPFYKTKTNKLKSIAKEINKIISNLS